MSKVQRHYDQSAEREWERLLVHRTEFAVTMRALVDHLPPPPASIVDIGGGPGRYSIALARKGYEVTLVDLSRESLDLAKKNADEAGVELSTIIHQDATELSDLDDASFDSTLLFGPLYHLLEKEERITAIREARRVLKPGSMSFATFITRFAPFRHSASGEPDWVIEHNEYALDLLESGKHEKGESFPSAYFAHPNEIKPLMEDCGFSTIGMIGCEGIVAGHEDKVNEFEGDDWEKWVDLNYRLGQDPALFGASDHMLYIGKKSA